MIFSARPLMTAVMALCGLAAYSAEAQTVEILGQGSLSIPYGVAVDAGGNVFVANTNDSKINEIPAAGGYATVNTILAGTGFYYPYGVALDSAGDLFIADTYNGLVEKIPAAGGYASISVLPAAANGDFIRPTSVAVDGAGNVFVADPDANAVYEILASGGYTKVVSLGVAKGNFYLPGSVALDAAGNVYVADFGNSAVKEILAAGGYTAVNTLGSGFKTPEGVAVDSSGNVYVADSGNNAVKEILAAGGYTTVQILAASTGNFNAPGAVAVDGSGNVYVADSGNNVVKRILLAPSPLAASVLPGGRSVVTGTPATVFATLLNAGSTALSGCGVSLPSSAPAGLSLTFQTTDPSSNALTGTANQAAAIPANSLQTFLLSFQSSAAVTASGLAPVFACQDVAPAAVTPGVDTVDLAFSATPVADIIALAATASSDGTVHVANGSGAFAVATINAGAAGDLTAEVDSGGASLPATAVLCQTDAAGQCQGTPAQSLPVSIAAGGSPTFSVFVGASGSIPFAPGATRIFVRFLDSSGVSHGSTSVAVTTN
jgi:sugar lactone lactonase YvrE